VCLASLAQLNNNDEIKCLGFCEIDKMALKVYREHFPDHPLLRGRDGEEDGDICKVDFRPFLGQVDLVVGGFPCQNLSSVRKLHKSKKSKKEDGDGLKGERSGLFFEFLRCLEECKPRFFIMENVASMSKKNRDMISELIGVEPVLLDSKDFTPQKRRRLFWCNFKIQEKEKEKELALGEAQPMEFSDILVSKKEAKKLAYTKRRVKYFLSPLKKSKKTRLETYRRFYYDTTQPKAPCLLSSANTLVLDYRFIGLEQSSKVKKTLFRKLAQVEAERLQGFPDGWTSSLSYTASIKRLGNAVTVPVVYHILCSLEQSSRGRGIEEKKH